jgi:hypothetical protein
MPKQNSAADWLVAVYFRRVESWTAQQLRKEKMDYHKMTGCKRWNCFDRTIEHQSQIVYQEEDLPG